MTVPFYSAIGLPEVSSTPASPSSGQVSLYGKTDHRVYQQTSAGVEKALVRVGDIFYNVADYGAKLNVVGNTDGAMTSGGTTLTSASAAFVAADVGKQVQVNYAGSGGNGPLVTTISSVTDATHVVLAASASATVSGATYYYGTDDTTAVANAVSAANSAGGGIVFFPAGRCWTNQITLYSRVHLLGAGRQTTTIFLNPSQYTDVIRSNGYAGLVGGAVGGGVTQCSVRNLTVNGNNAAQLNPMTTPAAPTVSASNSGGSLPAATYNYPVSRLSANGETLISGASANAVVTSGSSGSVTVTFPATVFGQTGWRVRGRTYPYNKIADVGLVANYVNTGTITPTLVAPVAALDASQGVAVFGYGYVVEHVTVKFCAGHGFYSEWAATETMSDPLNDWMDARVSDVHLHDNGGSGLVWNGPHDSILRSVVSAFNSTAVTNTYIGIHAAGGGYSSLFTDCHAFGSHAYAWKTEGGFFLNHCEGEGASVAQIWVAGDGVAVLGGAYFAAGATAATGIRIGSSAYSPNNSSVRAANISGFTTGPGIDLTFSGTGTHVQAWVQQASGTAIAGLPAPADADLDITVSGGSSTAPLRQFQAPLRIPEVATPATPPSGLAGLYFKSDHNPYWLNSSGTETGILPTDIQIFTSSGTWTKPAGATAVTATLVGGGGGGGAGRQGMTATIRCGGGGGAGASANTYTWPASAVPSSVAVTVGAGGAGGAAITAADTSGNNGTGGGTSQFGTLLKALGGGAGSGGTATTGTGGAANGGQMGGGNGGAASTTGGAGNTGTNATACPGGGSGGGVDATNTGNAGGAGGVSNISTLAAGTAGGAAGGSGGAGTAGATSSGEPGTSGGGGGGAASGVGGTGGAGGVYGGAGGGGGGSLDGNNSGAGGVGAAGIVVVVTRRI